MDVNYGNPDAENCIKSAHFIVSSYCVSTFHRRTSSITEEHGSTMYKLQKSSRILSVDEQLDELRQAKTQAEQDHPSGLQLIAIDDLKIPSLPAATVLLIEMCNDINVSYSELSSIIQADPGLSARVLRIANSAYYGQVSKTSSIQRALTVIGLKETRTIGLTYKLTNVIKDFIGDSFDFEAYWERSLLMAVMAREFACEMNCPLTNEAFLSGLLQDVGIIILRYNKPLEYQKIAEVAASAPDLPLIKIEQQLFRTNHAKIGAQVCARWKFPQLLTEAIRSHHKPVLRVVSGDRENEIRAAAYAASMMPGFLAGSQPIQIPDDLQSSGIVSPGALGPVLLRAREALEALQLLFEKHTTHEAQVTVLMQQAGERLNKIRAAQLEICQPPE